MYVGHIVWKKMTVDEMKSILRHPAINVSWFARQMYPGQRGAVQKLHRKLDGHNGQRFLPEEKIKLKEVFIEFANYEI